MLRRFRLILAVVMIVMLVLVAFAQNVSNIQAQASQDDGIGRPLFTKEPMNAAFSHTATTIPYWGNSFTYAGKTYPYIMVGTDPTKGPASSTVDTVLIPLSFTFSNGETLDGSTKTGLTLASPIFQAAQFTSGFTQYGDAIQRGAFWATGGSNPGYHVLLKQPPVLATVHTDVPQNQGQIAIGRRTGKHLGLMSYSWFSSHLKNLLGQLHISATTIPIFLTYNTFLYQNTVSNCCILGYHGATSSANGNGSQQIQTYIFAAYSDGGIFSSNFIQDIHGLSHEVSELMNDPFVNNVVPPWSVPTAPQYGCTNYLETGDPVVGIGFLVNLNGTTYHPEDEVYYSWFAREVPSRGQSGYYTYLNTFSSPAPGC